jgi:excisionase family DNA binding protein
MESINVTNLTPLFQLTVEQAESLFKSWIAETIQTTAPAPDPVPVFFSKKESCRLLHISLPTLDSYILKGFIEAKRVGSRILIEQEAISKALKEMPTQKYKRV